MSSPEPTSQTAKKIDIAFILTGFLMFQAKKKCFHGDMRPVRVQWQVKHKWFWRRHFPDKKECEIHNHYFNKKA